MSALLDGARPLARGDAERLHAELAGAAEQAITTGDAIRCIDGDVLVVPDVGVLEGIASGAWSPPPDAPVLEWPDAAHPHHGRACLLFRLAST